MVEGKNVETEKRYTEYFVVWKLKHDLCFHPEYHNSSNSYRSVETVDNGCDARRDR